MIDQVINLLKSHWKLILVFVILGIFIIGKSEEGFYGYGWIPIPTRSTYNMSYDLRGDPVVDRRVHPYRTREWLGSYFYGLFPKWLISPRHPYA
jgi:hypothetical protein